MTPTIDQAALRAAIGNSPAEVKTALMALYIEAGWPSLAEPWNDDAALYSAAEQLCTRAAEHGHTLTIPLTTDVLLARIEALPVDLRDRAALEVSTFNDGAGVPSVKMPHRWTVADWAKVDETLTGYEEVAAVRHRRVMAELDRAGGSVQPPEWRHTMIGCVTDGVESSSKRLTVPEVEHLAKWAETQSLHPDGAPPTAFTVPEWAKLAKACGTTQAELLAIGKAWLKARTLPTIAKLGDIATHDQRRRLVAHIAHEAGRQHWAAEAGPTVVTDADIFGPNGDDAIEHAQTAEPGATVQEVLDVLAPLDVAVMGDASRFVEIAATELGDGNPLLKLVGLIEAHRAASATAAAVNAACTEARAAVFEALKALGFDVFGDW